MSKWILNGAKAIGLSHIQDNKSCQDSYIAHSENDVDIVVLSEGCGSSRFSEYGSSSVVKVISKYISSNFDRLYSLPYDEIKKQLVNVVMDGVSNLVKFNAKVLDDYLNTKDGKKDYEKTMMYEITQFLSKEDKEKLFFSHLFDATVLFAAIKDERCLIGHCGDGFIVGYRNEKFEIISEEPKIGERNYTHYPSSIFFSVKAYNNETEWNLFRINKIEKNDFQAFILMSDGAEESLISKKKIFSPITTNNRILLDIVHDESKEDADNYLKELLEKTYRESRSKDGNISFITDDDVSVAIIVSEEYESSNYEEEKENDNNYDKVIALNEEKFIDTRDEEIIYEKENELPLKIDISLKKHLIIDKQLNIKKYNWLKEIFIFSIKTYEKKPYDKKEWINMIKKEFLVDNDDIKIILKYGKKCNVLLHIPFIKFEIKSNGENNV